MIKAVALADCNSFYASCEKIFNPAIADKPVVVLSNNDGIVVALSSEAKAIGIERGSPLFKIKELVKKYDVQVFSSNYALYGDISRRVFDLLGDYAPEIEVYSIDEAFMNFTDVNRDLGDYCRRVRKRINRCIGIPMSIGVAKTKTLAKLASKIAKKDPALKGVLDISKIDNLDNFLKTFPIGDVWGIGYRYATKLKSYGICTAYDFTLANENWVKKNMTVMGLRTLLELRGTPCIQIDDAIPDKKSIVSSRSFGRYITTKDEIIEAVASYATKAMEKLRKQKSATSLLYVFLRTNPFKNAQQYHNGVQINLPIPTDSTAEIINYAEAGVNQIFRDGYEYQKAGIMLSGIIPYNASQFALFDTEDREKMKKISITIDEINKKMGHNTLYYAVTGINKKWDMRREHQSPHYTTRWEDIPIVHAK